MRIADFGIRRTAGRRDGFTLVEMLMVIFVLSVMTLLGSSVLVAAFHVRDSASATHNQTSRQNALADQFRDDVALSTGVVDKLDRWTAGPSCLILRSSEGGHIVYVADDNFVERFRLPGEKPLRLPLGAPGTTVEFAQSGAEKRLVTLRFGRPLSGLKSKARRPLDITAALGGDLR